MQNGKDFGDIHTIECRIQPSTFGSNDSTFGQLNILLGAKRFFQDQQGLLWIPDQEYYDGSWGSIGGKTFKIPDNGRLPYGSDKNIRGTSDDPVYQTQQIGIEKYRFDVPNGEYEITLHFSELQGGPKQELVYNLDTIEGTEANAQRIFDVLLNDHPILESFNLAEQYGVASAVTHTVRITVNDNKGIEISFRPIEGEPVLNAIQLKKLYLARSDESNVMK